MDSLYQEQLREITEKFKLCRKAISALGDKTRQLIVLALLERGCKGVRVGELARKIQLSRPSVSHHLQILRDAELIAIRQEGTKNHYYIDSNEPPWKTLNELLNLIINRKEEPSQSLM